MKSTFKIFFAFLLFAFSVASQTAIASEPYRIVTTVGMVTDLVRNVAGEHAVVDGLIGEGIDPHLYKPTRNDVIALNEADVVFYNGLMLEGKMADLFVRVARRGKPVHAVSEELLDGDGYVMSDDANHLDPHIWMDPRGWMAATEVVVSALSEYDPENAEDYANNGKAFLQALKETEAYAKKVLGAIPESQRTLITAHDAFQYFGRAFGLEVRGIQGISTESEAGVRDIEELIDFIVDRGIPAVFVESSVSDKHVRALIEGCAARGHTLAIGGSLFSDAMGAAGTYEGSYLGMLDHNITTVSRSLGGNAPANGLRGKLSGVAD